MNDSTTAFARESDPGTSVDAAVAIKTTNLEQRVLETLREFGNRGATSFEVAERMRLNVVNVSPRFKPLMKKGFVRGSGRTSYGVGGGRARIVWIASVDNTNQGQLF